MNEIYLLHFIEPERPWAHARIANHAGHYIGWCGRGVPSRLRYHRAGRGSRLLKAVGDRGLDFVVALVIFGDRTLERRLKNRKHADRICPVCRGDASIRRHWKSGNLFVAFRPHRRDPLTRRISLLYAAKAA